MSEPQTDRDLPQWTVTMRIERYISVTVEAETKEAAIAKAEKWDIVGDEQQGDTINFEITGVHADE